MESHSYQFQRNDLVGHAAVPVVAAGLIGLCVQLLAFFTIFPKPRPTLDVDRTVIVHQVDASQTAPPSDVILLGDSSCMMNIDAPALGEQLGLTPLNLGTLSFLDLATFGKLLEQYLTHHPSHTPQKIVLITHPDFIRKSSASDAHIAAFEHYVAGIDHYYGIGGVSDPRRWLGTHIIEGRFVSRLPIPLPGSFRDDYGFTTQLLAHMDQRLGSVYDPRELKAEDLRGSADYRVAKYHRRQAADFMAQLPEQTQLYVGITPVPESFPRGSFQESYDRLLADWAAIFPGSTALDDLPPTLEDSSFATKTHLKRTAVPAFTTILGQSIESP